MFWDTTLARFELKTGSFKELISQNYDREKLTETE